MAVDYDLVVLGGTQEGYEAAQHAAQLGARVAWVLQEQDGRRSPLQTLGAIWATRISLFSQPVNAVQASWQQAIRQARLTAQTLTREDFQQLMVQGVDVIAEQGQLMGNRPLQIQTPSRHLTTRGLLLATGRISRLPEIPGLDTAPYETPEAFLQRETLPASVAILGSTPLALTLCQTLCRWGVRVTLFTPATTLLSREDPDVTQWITAQLKAEGAHLCLKTTVNEIKTADSTVTLYLSNTTVETAESLIVAASAPNLTGLNLDKWIDLDRPLPVTPYLQTNHPRIYACGSVLGEDGMTAIARQEARLAVENALFWNRHRIDDCAIPYDLLTQPEMARVGLTEPQAKRRYQADEVRVHFQDLYDTPKAQWLNATIGFCKLIAHRNGQILGVHGVGPDANEWVQTMALMMAQKIPWWKIAQYPTLPHSLTDILRQAAQQWERDRWQPGQWRRDWAENWFNWRRSR